MQNTYKPEGTLLDSFKNREYTSSPQGLERAMQNGVILEGMVMLCDNNFDLHISLGECEGIIPRSEVIYNRSDEPVKDIAILTRVGKPVCFKVVQIETRGGKNVAILSRAAAQRECSDEYIMKLRPGDIIPAKVTHLENFGSFVDIGCGLVSLLSVDCISVSRISHPRDRLSCGMNIMCIVKSIDYQTGRVYVTHRELLGTWEENAARFKTGQTVAGIIRSIEQYGIFVELAPNLAGLAEVHEGNELHNHIIPGQWAAVYIKSIIPERMKIKLVLIDTHKGTNIPSAPEYFIDTDRVRHIDSWRYSPESSSRVVETKFE